MIRVLIVDDSPLARQMLSKRLSHAEDIEVIGTAADAYVARDKIVALRPDVLTLDIEMPRMDGLTFLRKLMKYYPLPVVVVSSYTHEGSDLAIRALELGAVDVVCKPDAGHSVGQISETFVDRVRMAASAHCNGQQLQGRSAAPIRRDLPLPLGSLQKILAIGASTGGTEAIREILTGLPADTPGTLIVQHLPAQFTGAFAHRLNQQCSMEVREAKNEDVLLPGRALIAPGDQHMIVQRDRSRYFVQVTHGPLVHRQRPSVDVLFHSVARHAGANSVGVLLTGMGRDGVSGLLALRQAAATTIVQDEQSCVVFGMPKAAIRAGAAERIVSLREMSHCILETLADRSAFH